MILKNNRGKEEHLVATSRGERGIACPFLIDRLEARPTTPRHAPILIGDGYKTFENYGMLVHARTGPVALVRHESFPHSCNIFLCPPNHRLGVKNQRRQTKMKEWAQKRKQELEIIGAIELAEVFQLIVNLCELEEQYVEML